MDNRDRHVPRATVLTDQDAIAILQSQLGGRVRVNVGSKLVLPPRDFAEVIAAIKRKVGVEIDTVDLSEAQTVRDLVELVNAIAEAEVVRAARPQTNRPQARPPSDSMRITSRPTVRVKGGDQSSEQTDRPQARPPSDSMRITSRPTVRVKGGDQSSEQTDRPQARPPSDSMRITSRPTVRVKGGGQSSERTQSIVLTYSPWDVDPYAAKFRTQRHAVGKCTGQSLEIIKEAYLLAFEICSAAQNEIRWIEHQRDKQTILWNAWSQHPEASLGYWFGETVPTRGNLRYTIGKLARVINAWRNSFEVGFRGNLPVFIRCKTAEPFLGDPAARHVARNTIELMPRFFRQQFPERRALVMLHEMGHWAIGATEPRDERNSLCSGGWNVNENMCYREGGTIRSMESVFRGGNPRTLAEAYDRGNTRIKTVMLNNIDNYVCYMWNRFVDHHHMVLDLGVAGGKPVPAKPPTSKPIS